MQLLLAVGQVEVEWDRDCPSNLVDLVFSCLRCGTVSVDMDAGKGEMLSVPRRGENELKIWHKQGVIVPQAYFSITLSVLQH